MTTYSEVMIRQQFSVESYWDVLVYYDVDYSLWDSITKELREIGVTFASVREVFNMMYHRKAKAVTYSNIERHISIVLFNTHSTREDYINSIVHEAEHVKQAMLDAYDVEDRGEPPAYTIGYLVSKMFKVFNRFLYCS